MIDTSHYVYVIIQKSLRIISYYLHSQSEYISILKSTLSLTNIIKMDNNNITDFDPTQDVFCDTLVDKLNAYQIASLQMMQRFELGPITIFPMERGKEIIKSIYTKSAFLTNKVGSGKTRIAIALTQSQHFQNQQITFDELREQFKEMRETYPSADYLLHAKHGFSEFSITRFSETIGPQVLPVNKSLIIVPHSLVHQWVSEFNIMNVPVLDLSAWTKKQRDEMSETSTQSIANATVILVSDTKFHYFKRLLANFTFQRIIYDEIIALQKSGNHHEIKSQFLWLISATASYLRRINSSTSAPWRQCMNNITDASVRCSSPFIDSTISLPEPLVHEHLCEDPWLVSAISSLQRTPRGMLQALKADDLLEAVKTIGGGASTPLDFVNSFLNHINDKISKKYDIISNHEFLLQQNIANDDPTVHRIAISTAKNSIISLQNQISSLQEKIDSIPKGNCPICFESFVNPLLLQCCSNVICSECVSNIVSHSAHCRCPLCRAALDYKNLTLIVENPTSTENLNIQKRRPTKKQHVVNLLQEKKGKSFLIFSNFDGAFSLENELVQNNITCRRLTGTSATIQKIINGHKNKDIQVLLINSKNLGSGLNLQYVDEIIIYHDVGKFIETQVIGRVCRMGRDPAQPVIVHKLLYASEKK